MTQMPSGGMTSPGGYTDPGGAPAPQQSAAPVPPGSAPVGPGGTPRSGRRARAGWALGLGIAAFVLAWIPVLGVVLAAVALLLAVLELVSGNRGARAVWATVLGGIALVSGLLFTTAVFSLGDDLADASSGSVVEDSVSGDGSSAGGKEEAQKEDAEAAAAQSDSEPEAPEPEPEPETPGIGDPVRDGKFEFTVTNIETGVAEIGDEFLGKKAQGQFVLVHLTVENIGDEAQTFFGDNVTALDAEKREFSTDTEAAIYLDESNSFINEINPGNSSKGIVVFDVPRDVKLTALELHDSLFSGGVTVTLG